MDAKSHKWLGKAARCWLPVLFAMACECALAEVLPLLPHTGFEGTGLSSMLAADPAACRSRCGVERACSAFSHQALPPPAQRGLCLRYTGTVREVPASGVSSCRMPCKQAPLQVPIRIPPAGAIGPGVGGQILPPTGVVLPHVPPLATYTPPPPRSGVVGHELVQGSIQSVRPLVSIVSMAQCPAGKVALSAGYDFNAPAASRFGLEIRGAAPSGAVGMVLLRNANIAVTASAQTQAVCVQPPAGLRTIGPLEDCSASERLVGGGYMGDEQDWVANNGPIRLPDGSVDWGMRAVGFSPPEADGTPQVRRSWRGMCAPEAMVDGWEHVVSAPVSMGARGAASLSVNCTTGKVLLAAGVTLTGGEGLDLVSNGLVLSTSQVTAQVQNRNLIGGSGPVSASLALLCARSN